MVGSVLVSFLVAKNWPRPDGVGPSVLWWLVLIAVSTATLVAIDRVARRFLPLAALLRMSLVFPDEAPSRFSLALRSGTTKQLSRRLEEIKQRGDAATEAEAAETLLELAAALSQHDRFTRGHGERVRAYSALIGEELGLSKTDQSKLQWAGLIHDVGKLAVPSEILNKTGQLTDDEFDIIKTHPAEGMALVGPLAGWLGEWVLGVGEHHERWDGKGYPMGLAGEQISLAGRIVAVADVFDVITAARSYKKPQSPTFAREELAEHAGSQFDAKVVRAFLNISIGRLRATMWPLSWVAHVPFIGPSVTAPAAGFIATGTMAVVTALSGGAVGTDNSIPEALAAVVPASSTTTSIEANSSTTSIEEVPVVTWSSEPLLEDSSLDQPTTSSSDSTSTSTASQTSTTTSVTSTTGSSTTGSTTGSSTTAPAQTTTSTTSGTTTTIAQLTACKAVKAGETNMVGANLVGCDMSDLDLGGVDFQNADLTDSSLVNTDVRNFNMNGVTLDNVDMTDARFRDGSMVGVSGDNIVAPRLRVERVDLGYSIITNSNFFRGQFKEVSFGFATLNGSSFVQALFEESNFNDATAIGVTFTQSEHRNGEFYRVDASESAFGWATMIGVKFGDGQFDNAYFAHANMRLAVLPAADIDGVDLSFTDLGGATGTPVNYTSATYDSTICPSGAVKSTPCWP